MFAALDNLAKIPTNGRRETSEAPGETGESGLREFPRIMVTVASGHQSGSLYSGGSTLHRFVLGAAAQHHLKKHVFVPVQVNYVVY